jgi:hypothetical protein
MGVWEVVYGNMGLPDGLAFGVGQAFQPVSRCSLHSVASGGVRQRKMLLTTNQTFAGRSARRRMYHGNQFAP